MTCRPASAKPIAAAADGLWLNWVLGLVPVDQARMTRVRTALERLLAPVEPARPARPARKRQAARRRAQTSGRTPLMTRRSWIASAILFLMLTATGTALAMWKTRRLAGRRSGLGERARTRGVGDRRGRAGARTPADHHGDRHGAGAALDHAAQRARRHRPAREAHARPDRRGRHRARRARRLGRRGRTEGARSAGRARRDDAGASRTVEGRRTPRRKWPWIARAPSATSRWRRLRASRR